MQILAVLLEVVRVQPLIIITMVTIKISNFGSVGRVQEHQQEDATGEHRERDVGEPGGPPGGRR